MAITGRGGFPFNSRWMNGRKRDTLRKQIFYGDIDQSIQTIMTDWFFVVESEYFGILKRWTGSVWVKEQLKVYNGSWLQKPLKYWVGSEWAEIDISK